MTASAAAFLLVLQIIIGPLALAAQADHAPPRDALGGIICIEHAAQGAPADEQGSHKLPSCCLLGCNSISQALFPEHPGALLAIGLEARDLPLAIESEAVRRPRPETHPHNPRAPPALA